VLRLVLVAVGRLHSATINTRMISALRRAADGQRTRSCFYLYLDGVPRTKHKLIVRIGVGISLYSGCHSKLCNYFR
jgi:hypothetical protein